MPCCLGKYPELAKYICNLPGSKGLKSVCIKQRHSAEHDTVPMHQAHVSYCTRSCRSTCLCVQLQILSEEWQYSFYRGKLAAKRGAQAQEVLHLLAEACLLATAHKGGQTEPLYRLHASRLKLLLGSEPPLEAIAAFPFLADTQDRLQGEHTMPIFCCWLVCPIPLPGIAVL